MEKKVHEKGYRNRPLTQQQKASNTKKSKIRARVEHVFGFMEQSMNDLVLKLVGMARAIGILWLYLILIPFLVSSCGNNDYNKDGIELPEVVDFNYHVKPILSDKCFACHGPDKDAIKADLRLDISEGAIKKILNSGNHAIVPGSLRKSEAFQRITSEDPTLQMPPPEFGLTLTKKEIAILGKWIVQGAEYKPHWAFIPPSLPETPKVNNQTWIENSIDNFVLKKLEEKELTVNLIAEKEVLLRRVTLDLTGLPPTIEEIDNFLADKSDRAYKKVVDRLLGSQHYGERMALEWLDLARYADSNGYSTDGYRSMWPWRDWVIKAFNENMPYDQFITWQIAGDKIPNATKEQKLATAFLRNQKLNAEGGIIQEEFMAEYASDRTETVATAFLGLTFQCAKCHDHKYDPVSQKDYFQLYGFFNSVNERGLIKRDQNTGPQLLLTTKEVEETIAYLDQQIHKEEVKLAQYIGVIDPNKIVNPVIDLSNGLLLDFSFEKMIGGKIKSDVKPTKSFGTSGEVELVEGKNGQAIKFTGYDKVNIQNKNIDFERSDSFSYSFWLNSQHENEYMPVILHSGGKNNDFKGYEIAVINGYSTMRLISALPADIISVSTSKPLVTNQWTHYTFVYDGSSSANGIGIYVNGKKDEGRILFDQLNKSIVNKRNSFSIGGKMDYQVDVMGNGIIDKLKVYQRKLSAVEAKALYNGKSEASESVSQENLLEHYMLNVSKGHQEIQQEINILRKEKNQILDTISTVMVMQDLPEPRPTFILDRGAYDAPLEQVFPDTPEFILPFSKDLSNDRLGLAKWLVDKHNPLTARVIVNRYWQLFFGQGIVKTVDDFGNQGTLPHHPQLLDYLASSFVETGWDLKKLHRQIVLSATYQQSSRVSEDQRKSDPENILLARGPNHRLQAELIRDCALAASGLMIAKVGGPSVRPYQPAGLWTESNTFSNVLDKYRISKGDELYRRGLYTFWRRTLPPPAMLLFDAPTRDLCIVKRQGTNTPLQALVLLNDPQFFEAARVLAERVIDEEELLKDQIILAYRLLTGLFPAAEVVTLLEEHFTEQKEKFIESPKLVEELLQVGSYPINEKLSPFDVSAMSIVCNIIISFDETIVKR